MTNDQIRKDIRSMLNKLSAAECLKIVIEVLKNSMDQREASILVGLITHNLLEEINHNKE